MSFVYPSSIPPHNFVLVDFNVRSREGLTPLLVAAKNCRKNAVLWLLQDGADVIDVNAVDKDMRNAIHLAALNPKCEYTIEVQTCLCTFK